MGKAKRRLIYAAVFTTIVTIAAMGAFIYRAHTLAEQVEPNPAAIAVVRLHRLTPGPIITTTHLTARGNCPTSIISFHSDGLKEYALAQQPAGQAPKGGYPVIVFAHGYTSPIGYATDNSQYSNMINWYCQHNFLVLKPDYRGYGHSEGLPANGLYSPVDTYDILNLVASLPSYPAANPNRVALVGHSMGGGIVLRAGVASHNLPIKAIVTVAGAVGSLHTITYNWTGKIPPDVSAARRQALAAEGPPNQNPGYWYDGSTTNYLNDLKAPVQINQGLSDTSVPAAFAGNLNASLTTAHQPHEYFTYPDTGHLFANPLAQDLMLERSLSFINRSMN